MCTGQAGWMWAEPFSIVILRRKHTCCAFLQYRWWARDGKVFHNLSCSVSTHPLQQATEQTWLPPANLLWLAYWRQKRCNLSIKITLQKTDEIQKKECHTTSEISKGLSATQQFQVKLQMSLSMPRQKESSIQLILDKKPKSHRFTLSFLKGFYCPRCI